MNIIEGENITDVFYMAIENLLTNPSNVYKGIHELTPVLIKVSNPKQRCLVIPNRLNNIIQTVAETIWVLGGRNDLAYLTTYLPRAGKFSDDGLIWRAGYGPRIRNWDGVDQLINVVNMLKVNPLSARGVISLFDPKVDSNLEWKDVPCNNWIQFSIRDNKLNMYVSLRANDVVWGFSGINFFEWSMLQELVANWLNVEVGNYYHFTGFLTLFKRHNQRAHKMLENRIDNDIYSNSNIVSIPIDIKQESLNKQLEYFFQVEQELQHHPEKKLDLYHDYINTSESKFLAHSLGLMYSYLLIRASHFQTFNDVFSNLKNDHTKIATAHVFRRNYGANFCALTEPLALFDYEELCVTN